MAIPFHLPTDEETEDSYRRLHQLLWDLYHVLRQILLRSQDEGGERGGATASASAPSRSRPAHDVSPSRRLDQGLPDLVSSTLDCRCQPSRRRRRHRRRRSCDEPREQYRLAQVQRPPANGLRREQTWRNDQWATVGEHLRKIAEEFRTTYRKEEPPESKEQNLQLQVKTSGLFSLLVPSNFRHSLWTTVILLVGWRILVRR